MAKNHADHILEQIVGTLKEAREAQGLSQEKLARKAGVTRPAISFMESKSRKPSLLLCLKLCYALGLSFKSLVEKAENKAA